MPTRLMDAVNLRLVNTNDISKLEAEVQPYVASSYLWGSAPSLVTKTTNLSQHLEIGFDFNSLPMTIQDAVTVTKYLGIQFLWVDCICIIQDDSGDWKRESALMGMIFRNAYCTIAATSARDLSDGFLKPRLPRNFASIHTPAGYTTFLCELIDDFQHEVDGAVINQRAWTFQKRVLSRRTIHFARNQFYWQCGDGIHCETLTKLSQ